MCFVQQGCVDALLTSHSCASSLSLTDGAFADQGPLWEEFVGPKSS